MVRKNYQRVSRLFILALLLFGLLVPGVTVCAMTIPEIETELVELEKELVHANQMIVLHRNEPKYRDDKLEENKKRKLVYWSQKTVRIRNRMAKLKVRLKELREIEFYHSNQPVSSTSEIPE